MKSSLVSSFLLLLIAVAAVLGGPTSVEAGGSCAAFTSNKAVSGSSYIGFADNCVSTCLAYQNSVQQSIKCEQGPTQYQDVQFCFMPGVCFTYPVAVGANCYAGTGAMVNGANSVSSCTYYASPTATLTATPSSVQQGLPSQLSWTSTNATSCTGTNFSTGGATSGVVDVSPGITTTYTVTCSGPGGSASASKTVTVTPYPSGSCSTYQPNTYAGGTPIAQMDVGSCYSTCSAYAGATYVSGYCSQVATVYYWNTTGGAMISGVSCYYGPGPTNQSPPSPPSYPHAYTVTNYGTSYCTAPTAAAPTATLTATPTSVQSGSPATLKWTSTNATMCTGTNFSTGGSANNNTTGVSTGNLTQTTTYGIHCTGAGGAVDASVTVTVTPPAEPTYPPCYGEGCSGGTGGGPAATCLYTGVTQPSNNAAQCCSNTTGICPLPSTPSAQCADGIDNDGNGLTDLADTYGCSGGSADDNESTPAASINLAGPTIVVTNTPAPLTWTAANVVAGSCRVTSDTNYNSGVLSGSSGSLSPTVEFQTLFTLRCTNLSGQFVTDTLTVQIQGSIIEN